MRRAVSGALAGVRDGLDGKAVAAAVAEFRRDLLVEARTPAGLVAIVGRAAETRTDPRAAADDAAALASVDVATIRRRLDEMLRLPPSVAQVRP
jgi:transcription initiation factor TFIIIB Brf1 subunit/transcription initiation factor TFIIB